MTISGVVLAGGKSTRMGRNKAILEIGGKRLIDRLVEGLQGIFPEVIIVANTLDLYDYLGVRVVPDLIRDKGALGGIYTAAAIASNPWVFVMACDMPFFNPGLIRYLATLTDDWDAVVPYTDEWEPLYALYAKTCLPQMERRSIQTTSGSPGSFPTSACDEWVWRSSCPTIPKGLASST